MTTKIDNFDQIRRFMLDRSVAPSKEYDYFYFIQLLRRKKENPEMPSNNELIKSFYVGCSYELINLKSKIIRLCKENNARAYIRLNRRSYRVIALRTLEQMAASIASESYNVRRTYESVVGQYHSDPEKTWVIDMDTKDDAVLDRAFKEVSKALNACEKPSDHFMVETRNGFHIIARPFDVRMLSDEFKGIDIHKDNPTILYIP